MNILTLPDEILYHIFSFHSDIPELHTLQLGPFFCLVCKKFDRVIRLFYRTFPIRYNLITCCPAKHETFEDLIRLFPNIYEVHTDCIRKIGSLHNLDLHSIRMLSVTPPLDQHIDQILPSCPNLGYLAFEEPSKKIDWSQILPNNLNALIVDLKTMDCLRSLLEVAAPKVKNCEFNLYDLEGGVGASEWKTIFDIIGPYLHKFRKLILNEGSQTFKYYYDHSLPTISHCEAPGDFLIGFLEKLAKENIYIESLLLQSSKMDPKVVATTLPFLINLKNLTFHYKNRFNLEAIQYIDSLERIRVDFNRRDFPENEENDKPEIIKSILRSFIRVPEVVIAGIEHDHLTINNKFIINISKYCRSLLSDESIPIRNLKKISFIFCYCDEDLDLEALSESDIDIEITADRLDIVFSD